ncbi:MAG TPA: DNA polymerase IV, partial [Chondromyces sp.]|nr:DNA polymerase IV [Chondromyces sp.]
RMQEFYPKNGRVILHVDMNSFYASVEMALDPSLKGKPLAIAGNPKERRGVIVTCSYEARKFGVKTTMSVWEAKKLCPSLIIKPPNFKHYRAASQEMFSILRQFSSLVEPVSIDEGYMDITESYELGTPIEIAHTIQGKMKEELDLPCSIGIAPNKFLAKTASDMKKPMGITILRKRELSTKLWPLPTIDMHGVGKKTSEKLAERNIYTIGDLAQTDEWVLKKALGINGIKLKERANGIDLRPVDPEAINEFKSVGNSVTLPQDQANQQELLTVLGNLSEEVSSRLKNKKVLATTVSITVRYKDRKTITRSRKLLNPISTSQEVFHEAKLLFLKHWNGNPVRLLGVTAQELIEKEHAAKQLDLFSYESDAQKESLLKVIEHIRTKYGENSIRRGEDLPLNVKTFNKGYDTSFNKDFLADSTKSDHKGG